MKITGYIGRIVQKCRFYYFFETCVRVVLTLLVSLSLLLLFSHPPTVLCVQNTFAVVMADNSTTPHN